jgi:Uma2 family endonuclease
MAHLPTDTPVDITAAVNALVTEDDEPVDNIFSEKQQRLLTEPLYSSWTPPPEEDQPDHPRPFWAAANVGVFPSLHQPPLVPDVFISLDVSVPDNMFEQSHRSYFFWEFGKAPEVVIEIVSNRKGGELSSKRRDYARIGVTYYVVYDPIRQLSDTELSVFALQNGRYHLLPERYLPLVGLGLTFWSGVYEGKEATWLRWCDAQGTVIPTGAERAIREAEARQEVEARLQAETEARQRAEAEVAQLQEALSRLRSQP